MCLAYESGLIARLLGVVLLLEAAHACGGKVTYCVNECLRPATIYQIDTVEESHESTARRRRRRRRRRNKSSSFLSLLTKAGWAPVS
jgi:hypothetical protein